MALPHRLVPWLSARFVASGTLAVAAAVAPAAGCGSLGVHPRQLEDGTLLLECDGELSDCVRQAEDYCGDARIELLDGRLRDGSVGNGGALNATTIAEVRFVCGKALVHLRSPLGRRKAPPGVASAPAPAAPPSAAAAPAPLCVPGTTQPCVGPGACAGGQACLPDGSGFGRCDCAPAPAPAPSAAPPR